MTDNNNPSRDEKKQERLEGSRTDPQKTEMEELKQGGKKPIVHEEDKPLDHEGKPDKA